MIFPLFITPNSKEKILANIPDLKDYKEGRITLLAFKEDVGPALKKA